MDDKKNIEEIARQLLAEDDTKKEPEKKPRAPRKAAPPLNIVINGGQGIKITNGNKTVNKTVHKTVNNYHTAAAPVKPTVIVQTGVGVISAAQKRQITDWVDAAVTAGIVRKPPKTHASVWNGLKKYMKVNKYDEILATDFEKAKKWLLRTAAITKSMPSAVKKNDALRPARYKAIHARCKERDLENWRFAYMEEKFNIVTMKELSDDQLETLYRAVMGKK